MKRLYLILTVAAILVVILLIALHPALPFFGPGDARVMMRPASAQVRQKTDDVAALSAPAIASQQSASPDAASPSPNTEKLHVLELRRQQKQLLERDEEIAMLRKQLAGAESARIAALESINAGHIGNAAFREAEPADRKASAATNPSKQAPDSVQRQRSPSSHPGKETNAFRDLMYGALTHSKPSPSSLLDPVVVRAGDVVLRASEFEAALRALPAEYQSNAIEDTARKQLALQYLQVKILAAEGTTKGLAEDRDVKSQIAFMRENIVAEAMRKDFERTIDVSDAELRAAYDHNRTNYEQIRVRHILVAFKGGPEHRSGKAELTDAQARVKAEELRGLIASGADFATLARSESDDVESASRGGDLGLIKRGDTAPEFEQAVFNVGVGEVMPIVKTSLGYHIIQVAQRTVIPFEDARAALVRDVRKQKLEQIITSLVAASEPVFNDTYFASGRHFPAAKKP